MKMTKKYLPILFLIILLFVSCADFLEPIFNNGELIIEAIIPTVDSARDIFVSDDFIYIAENQAGFSIYNIMNDSLVIHYYGTIRNARLICCDGLNNTLFLYDQYGNPGKIWTFDISDMNNPINTFSFSGGTSDVNAMKCQYVDQGEIDFQWTNDDVYTFGNYIVDEPWLSSYYHYDFPNTIEDFYIKDSLLFMTGQGRGLYITNKNNRDIISEVNTPGTAVDVKVHDNYAYVADKEYGISVIDISDITQPELVFNYDTSGYAQRIDVEGDYLVVASGGGGVYLFDISDRTQPEFADRWDDSDIGYTYDVDMHNGEVFVATREGVYRMLIIHDK